jgi:type VI secretion system secreted protein VgrG
MPFNQSTRIATVTTPFGKDELGLLSLTGTESLSSVPFFELTMVSERKRLDPNEILGKTVAVTLNTAHGQKKRYFHGHVTRFGRAGMATRYYAYRAVISPWPWFLSLTANCRVFQNKTVPEIVQKVCQDHGFDQIELRMQESYTPWEYCVQYRETDLTFINRLMEQEGICYFIKYEENKHTLVLADSPSSYQAFPGYTNIKLRHTNPADTEDREHIREFTAQINHVSGAYAHTDYDFERPRTDLYSRSELPGHYSHATFETYDYPGEYVQYHDGEAWARTRMEAIHAQMEQATGRADSRGIVPGSVFSLTESPFPEENRKYLVTSAQYELHSGEFESGRGVNAEVFECRFNVQPAEKQFRPPLRTEKPKIFGIQTAVVVGPKAEEIYTDKYGRIKVHFHWDREGKRDENSSCWIRVAQPWAGKGWGSVSIPRIGHEVVVDFLEGDPDQPLVIGSVYNGDQMPPYELPGKKVVTGLKSNTHKGKGYNEMLMDDTAGQEKVTIHGQYDMSTTAEHDHTLTVHNNHASTVDGTHTEKIKGTTEITITEGAYSHKVAANKAERFAKAESTLISETAHIHIQAATSIQLHVGASSLRLGQDGNILLQGHNVIIQGDATVTVKAGAITSQADAINTINGALVFINSKPI